jgi:hypothetical protein
MPQGITDMQFKPEDANFDVYLRSGFIPQASDFDKIMEEHEYES